MLTSDAFILRLPTELHQVIVDSLSENRDLISIALTCRHLSSIALPLLHTCIIIHDLGESIHHFRRLLEHRARHETIVTLFLTLSKTSQVIARDEVDKFRDLVLGKFEFPNLQCFSLRSGHLKPAQWELLLGFLARTRSIKHLKLNFLEWKRYRAPSISDDGGSGFEDENPNFVTPDLLPNLESLSCDTVFLARLARARVSSLRRLQYIDLVESVIWELSHLFWADIIIAADLLQNIPVVEYTYLHMEIVQPPFNGIASAFLEVFKNVEVLSTNLGEGFWKGDELLAVLSWLESLRILNIPALLVRECVSGFDENSSRPWVYEDEVEFSVSDDLEFSDESADAEELIMDLNDRIRATITNCAITHIILHMPGWYPSSSGPIISSILRPWNH